MPKQKNEAKGKPASGELIGFRVAPAKAKRAKAMAGRQGLSVSQVLRYMLDAYLAGQFKVELTGGPALPGESGAPNGGEHD